MPSSISAQPAGSGRNAYIDTIRGWSIFGVVCIHFAGSFVTFDAFAWSPSFYLGLTLNQVFNFAVPLFIFLSGVLAGSSKRTLSLGDYYRSRLWRIGFPYLLASIASFYLLKHYAEWQAVAGYTAKFMWLFQRVFFFGIEPPLYFIPLIIELYLLQPALKALPGWLNRVVPAVSPARFALILTGLLLVEVEQPGDNPPLTIAGCPIKFTGTPSGIYARPPLLGEHTEQILAEAGIADASKEKS